jgi:hypothetical protein
MAPVNDHDSVQFAVRLTLSTCSHDSQFQEKLSTEAVKASAGPLKKTTPSTSRQYLEPLGLWADLVDYLHHMRSHMQMAHLYIQRNGDHEYARRYFQQRIKSGMFAAAPDWWGLPVGRFLLNSLPFPNHLDAFIRHVPSLLAESINVYASEYVHDGFRVKSPFKTSEDLARKLPWLLANATTPSRKDGLSEGVRQSRAPAPLHKAKASAHRHT